MPKNIVICCDGTGNEIEGNLSNVLKLYRIARRDQEQRVYYDPGIGTIGQRDEWSRLKQNAKTIFGLATGYGLDNNILNAYRFLARLRLRPTSRVECPVHSRRRGLAHRRTAYDGQIAACLPSPFILPLWGYRP